MHPHPGREGDEQRGYNLGRPISEMVRITPGSQSSTTDTDESELAASKSHSQEHHGFITAGHATRHFATFGLAPAAAFFIPNPARHPFQGWRLGHQVRTLDALGQRDRGPNPKKGYRLATTIITAEPAIEKEATKEGG